MTTTLTGKIINGNYINAPRRSCKPYDYPTEERVTVELDGKTYERTIYERVTWRNSAKSSVSARFVIINGTNYEVAKVEEYDEMEMLHVLDEDEHETLYAVRILTGDIISVIITEDGTELFNDDWQGNQPQTLDEVRNGYWRWYTGDEIDF